LCFELLGLALFFVNYFTPNSSLNRQFPVSKFSSIDGIL